MIKNTFMEKLDHKNGDKNAIDSSTPFDATRIEAILKSKMRSSIYDIKEEDFLRVKSIR